MHLPCRMKFSIIVPVGRPETAARTVASILAQSALSEVVQIILVGADLDALRARYPEPRIQPVALPKRLNPSATRIAGVAEAIGDWFLFVDDDIELEHRFLERLAAVIAGEPGAGAIGARLPGREKTYFARVTDLANFWSQQGQRSGAREWLYSAALAVCRRAYEEAGGFAPELAIGEDVDLTRRIRDAGYPVLYRAELIGFHNHRRTTLASSLAYSWQNGGLAGYQFKDKPQVRAWSAGAILRTLVLSLAGTLRANGRSGMAFYVYLPGIVIFYSVFALSLEYHYQRCLHDFLRDNNPAGPDGQAILLPSLLERSAQSRARGHRGRALFFRVLATLRQNGLFLLALLLLLALLVIGACASA